LGCGSGQFGQMVLSRGYKHYIGMDFSSKAIELARKRLSKIDADRYTLVCCDIEKNRDKIMLGRKFDIVVLCETLEHLNDDIGIVKRIPSGKLLVFSVPNRSGAGHVRWFDGMMDVLNRYEKFLDDIVALSQIEIRFLQKNSKKGYKSITKKYFIVSGIRK